jgi:hypothetical protein
MYSPAFFHSLLMRYDGNDSLLIRLARAGDFGSRVRATGHVWRRHCGSESASELLCMTKKKAKRVIGIGHGWY